MIFKEIKQLKTRVEQLENKIAVMEFKENNKSGFKLQEDSIIGNMGALEKNYSLLYLKFNNIKKFELPTIYSDEFQKQYWELSDNILRKKTIDTHRYGTVYKTTYEDYEFDVDEEILVKIKKIKENQVVRRKK